MKGKGFVFGCAVLGLVLCAGTVLGHGFQPPPSAGAGFGIGGGNPSSGTPGTTPATPAAPSTAPPGFTPPAKSSLPGTTQGGRASGRLPSGAARRNGGSDGGADASGSDAKSDTTAGSLFKGMLKSDGALIKDRTAMLEVSCLDAALRKVELRVQVRELRKSAADVRRRIDVETRGESGWELAEVFLVNDSSGSISGQAWTKEGGVRKLGATPLDERIGGTPVTLTDLLPFDGANFTYTFKRASEVNFVAHETYALKLAAESPIQGMVTFRSDLRCPTHAEWTRSGVRFRAYDWTGWRYAGGIVVPSRVSVLGASLEPFETVDIREANVNTNLRADLFEPSRLAGGEVVIAR
jgi:hypothetical protein